MTYLTSIPQELEEYGLCKTFAVRKELIHLKHIQTEIFVRKSIDINSYLYSLEWSLFDYIEYLTNRTRRIFNFNREYKWDINEIIKSDYDNFFPAECQLSHKFLSINNLYRHSEKNVDPEKKGFFEDNGRVKAMKFRGIISSCFIIPVNSLSFLGEKEFKIGQEFNCIDDEEICRKYIRGGYQNNVSKQVKLLDKIVDSRMAPEHPDTAQLFRNLDHLNLNDYIAVTYKLHGTSARYYNTLTKRKLSWYEWLLLKFSAKIHTEEYSYVVGSRRVIKSVNFSTLDNKQHFYDSDLWTQIGQQYFKDKLNKGEAVYCEIIGRDYTGKAIQPGYTYGLEIPKVYIYRISNISPQGIEIDLPFLQMEERAKQLGIECCPPLFYGKLETFIKSYSNAMPHELLDNRDIGGLLEKIFYDGLLERSSILDASCVEEGFCLRIEKYPRPEILKIKSKGFLLHEGALLDKDDVVDIEEQQTQF